MSYLDASTQKVTAENGIEYAYRDVGESDVPLVLLQHELRKVLGATGARVTEAELALGHAHEHLDDAGHPIDPAQADALRDSVRTLLGELQNVQLAA